MDSLLNSLLPFIDYAFTSDVNVGSSPFNVFYQFNGDEDTELTSLFNKVSEDELDVWVNSVFEGIVLIPMVKIDPLGLYFPLISKIEFVVLSEVIKRGITKYETLLNYSIDKKLIYGKIKVVDYNSILESALYDEDTHILVFRSIEGVKEQKIENPFFYNKIVNNESLVYEFVEMSNKISDDFVIPKTFVKKPVSSGKSTSSIESLITTLLTGTQKGTKSVPCLVGLSGVAKSAVIKAVAKKMNKRMVDFRAAFLDRLKVS